MKSRRLSFLASFTLIAVLAVALAGCGDKKEGPVDNPKWDPNQLPKGAYDKAQQKGQPAPKGDGQ